MSLRHQNSFSQAFQGSDLRTKQVISERRIVMRQANAKIQQHINSRISFLCTKDASLTYATVQ